MSSIKLSPNASGTGIFTIAAPNSNTDRTLTLPDASGTFLTNSGTEAGAFSTLSVNSNNISAVNSLGFRNRIINGDCRIDQRNAGAAVTTANSYPVDRWVIGFSNDGAFSSQRSTTAPAGFSNSLYFTTTTADSSLAATQFACTLQKIEGFNVADLGWGAAGAQTVTLSFWTRSTLTGTFGGSLRNGAGTRSYPFTYTISAANTWEYKTVTVPGDTTGTWETGNGIGLDVIFGLGVGSTYSGTAGAWAGTNLLTATGAVSVIGTLNANWYVTGVQLEAGSVATPFERRDYGRELMMCQRYFLKWTGGASNTDYPPIGSGVAGSSTQAYVLIPTPVTLRAVPVISFTGSVLILDGTVSPALTSVNTIYTPGANSFWVTVTGSAGGLTGGRGVMFYCVNATTNSFSVSAEL